MMGTKSLVANYYLNETFADGSFQHSFVSFLLVFLLWGWTSVRLAQGNYCSWGSEPAVVLAQGNYSISNQFISNQFQIGRWCGIDFNLEIITAREAMLRFAVYLFDWLVAFFILANVTSFTAMAHQRRYLRLYEEHHEKADVCILLLMALERVTARTFDLNGTGSDDRGTWSQPAQQPMTTKDQRLQTPTKYKQIHIRIIYWSVS